MRTRQLVIEHAGALERVRSRQVSFLDQMLDPARMQRISESEVLDAGAYPLVTYLDDLKAGVFSELASGATIDPYRRNLQRAYVERLEYLMSEEPDNQNDVDVSQSDNRPLARAQLAEIMAEARAAAGSATDRVTRAHLEDLAARAEAVLDGATP